MPRPAPVGAVVARFTSPILLKRVRKGRLNKFSNSRPPLDRGWISTRTQGGTELSYLEGWDDIATANRIFGYDQWDRELVELTQVEARDRTDEEKKGYRASYHAKVRVTVHAEDRTTVREGIGSGHGYGYSLGEAVESAVKEGETDAMKRALSTWATVRPVSL